MRKNSEVALKNFNTYKSQTVTKEMIAMVCHIAIASDMTKYLPSCSQQALLHWSVYYWSRSSLETYLSPFYTHVINYQPPLKINWHHLAPPTQFIQRQ